MAETEFSNFSPSIGRDRVEGAPPVDPLAAGKTIRADLQHPLQRPPAPEPEPKPKPPELTETEKRERLVDALEAKRVTEQALSDAIAAHERAMHHRQRCQAKVAEFATLQAEVDRHTVDALREAGRATELPEALQRKIADRAQCEIALAASERAEASFMQARAIAVEQDKQAQWALSAAFLAVTNIERVRLQGDMEKLECRVAAYRQVIGWSDGASPWSDVVRRLKADPMNADLAVSVRMSRFRFLRRNRLHRSRRLRSCGSCGRSDRMSHPRC